MIRLVPEQPQARAALRKTLLFLVVVMLLTFVYQAFAVRYIVPNMAISFRRADPEVLAGFEKSKRKMKVLVMLEADADPQIPHQLPIFDDPQVREAMNRLGGVNVLMALDPQKDEDREWMAEKGYERLPVLVLYASGYDAPVRLSLDRAPAELARAIDDVRFERHVP